MNENGYIAVIAIVGIVAIVAIVFGKRFGSKIGNFEIYTEKKDEERIRDK